MFSNHDINEALVLFYVTIRDIINNHTPITKFNPNKYPIWYSKELMKVINDKEYYFKLKQTTRNSIIISLHKEKRKEFKRLKQHCLRIYESDIESKVKNNPKCFLRIPNQ